jgi:nudix-type nucleoside diphosphatase (YffH/AdpP family)
MAGSRKVDMGEPKRLLDDFFKVDEVSVAHERADGTMSPRERRLIFERGDAAAVLLYNPDTNQVVLVDQFKVPTLIARRRDNPMSSDGWITETVAGMIDRNETAEEAAVRETMEETGYKVKDLKLICQFFSSPGGTSERIFLYFSEVGDADKLDKGGGLPGEDITVVQKSANALFDELEQGEIKDPKLIVGAYWLRDYIRRMKPLDFSTVAFRIDDHPENVVGYKTGAIEDIRDVDIWVNSENSDMMMDRFIGKTISAKIRYLGANKEDETVVEDTIQEGLRVVIGERAHVKIGTVLVTESGMLHSTHQVQRIFHVATVEGGPGAGVKADPDKLKLCVENVLKRVDQENNRLWRLLRKKSLNSIMFPLIGSGDGGIAVESVAEIIIPAAINYFRTNPNPTLKEIYFLAFRNRDRSACERVLRAWCTKGVLSPVGTAR